MRISATVLGSISAEPTMCQWSGIAPPAPSTTRPLVASATGTGLSPQKNVKQWVLLSEQLMHFGASAWI